MFDNSEKRFEETYKQDSFGSVIRILKDHKTGVSYLYTAKSNYGGGLTPLLDFDGRPIKE